MLGAFRISLAILVAMFHIGGFPLVFGLYSVQAFYAVSGYLMTAVLNEAYRRRSAAFWTNRFLRLFPPYYIVASLTLATITVWPSLAGNYHAVWRGDPSLREGFANLTMIPLAFPDWQKFRLVPPSWSVAIEIINYFLLWAFIARGFRCAAAVFIFAAAYHIYCLSEMGLQWQPRYMPWQSAVLPFTAGSITYFLLQSRKAQSAVWAYMIIAPLWLANIAFASLTSSPLITNAVCWYANIIMAAAVTGSFAHMRHRGMAAALDKRLGDLAYPLFLSHHLTGFFVTLILPGFKPGTPMLFAASAIPLLSISAILAVAADKSIEPIRRHIRTKA